MRFTVIGDVGVREGMLHVGDEAMFEAALVALRRRGVEVTGVSAAPRETAGRYGIAAIDRIGGWGADRSANLARLSAVLADPRRLDDADPARAVVDAVRRSDAVVIAGGGNLASTWPLHVFERVAVARLAAAAGVPLAVTGQTLGPALNADDRALVSALLRSAEVVGVRERRSFELAAALGVAPDRLRLGPDDASLIDSAGGQTAEDTSPHCLVTVANHVGAHDRATMLRAIATLLDGAVTATGLRIVFLGHFSPLTGEPRGDETVHESIRSSMAAPSSTVRVTDSGTAAGLARRASLVVTSRYHPAVFAAPAGVPVVAIPVDAYTEAKLEGVLELHGESGILPAEALLQGAGTELITKLWSDRTRIRERAEIRRIGLRVETEAWWDRLVACAR